MKTLKFFTASFLALSLSGTALAGGEALNCSIEYKNVAVYGGYTDGCYDRGNYISSYFPVGPDQTRWLQKNEPGNTYSCLVTLNYAGTRQLPYENCDYKPSARLTIDNFSTGEVYVEAKGYDKDGTYTVALYIDGVKQSNTSKFLHGNEGDYWLIESVVTDNDGYKSTKSAYATITNTGSMNPF